MILPFSFLFGAGIWVDGIMDFGIKEHLLAWLNNLFQ